MNPIKKIFFKRKRNATVTNSNSGKPFDEMYDDTGVFQYTVDGFVITHGNLTLSVNWEDIQQILVYKIDRLTIDEIAMDIVLKETNFTITEELPGWYQFVLKTKEVFPSIPKEWDIEIIWPAFATNLKVIYKKG